jgi:predicted small metal-binding protein
MNKKQPMTTDSMINRFTLKSIYSSKNDYLYEVTIYLQREAGFNCDYIVKGETDEEILMNSQQHAMSAHGMKVETFTTQYKDKLKGLIKDTDVKL